VKVRIGFESLDPRILPDMGVKTAFQEEGSGETGTDDVPIILIPQDAVRKEKGKNVVFVVANERLERRAVRTGALQNDMIEILSGLTAGERVVLDGPTDLSDGKAIKEVKP